MKRLGAIILALAMLFSTTALASVLPEADKTLLQAGETINVTVKLDAPIEGVYGMTYKLYFDETLFDYNYEASTAGEAISGVQASVKAMTDGEGKQYVLIQYVDLTAQGQTVAAGNLYTLAFTAKSDITADASATFLLQKGKVRDTSRQEITGDAVEVPADKANLTVTVQPAPSTDPTLALGAESTLNASAGQEIQVPVSFLNTPTLGMAAFVVRYDGEKLSYVGEDHAGGIADGNLNVAAMEGSDNCLVVSTLGLPVASAGLLCTLKFTVKDSAAVGESALIELPSLVVDDSNYPMVLDENMLPVGGMKYQPLTVNIVEAPKVTAISLDQTELTLKTGEQQTLIATVEAEDGASEYALELSEESRQYLSDEEQAARVEEAAMELSAENGPVSGRYEIYRSLTRSVERLYSDLQAAGKQDEAAIALAYGDYLSVGDLIKRDAYPEKAETYNKTAGAFPANLISGLWGVGQLETFGR